MLVDEFPYGFLGECLFRGVDSNEVHIRVVQYVFTRDWVPFYPQSLDSLVNQPQRTAGLRASLILVVSP